MARPEGACNTYPASDHNLMRQAMTDAILADVESSGIYQIRNLVNGKRYIGSAKCFRKRWASHRSSLRKNQHSSRHLQNSWNKNGEGAFAFEVIELCGLDVLIEREQWWLDNAKPEYNVSPTAGSPLGVKHAPEFGRKVSERFKGKKKAPDHVERMRKGIARSWKNPAKRARNIAGIIRSYDDRLRSIRSEQSRARWADPDYREAMREKIRASHDDERRSLTSSQAKNRWADPEYRARLKVSLSGRQVPESTREKIRASLTGRKMSIETKRKKSALNDDQVRELRRMRGGGSSYAALASHFGVSNATVSRIVLGKRYKWVD